MATNDDQKFSDRLSLSAHEQDDTSAQGSPITTLEREKRRPSARPCASSSICASASSRPVLLTNPLIHFPLDGKDGIYALVETAKANGVEPWAYLKQVFIALPQATTVEQVEVLLPWAIQLRTLSCR